MSIQGKFPIHWHVWNNLVSDLKELLAAPESKEHLECKDPHGRTPLMLAVTLGRSECADLLLSSGANALTENASSWTVVDEAICNGDPVMLSRCIQANQYQKATQRATLVPRLLQQLREAPDFYLEMKWEFTTWLKLPLLSKMCPSDVCKIWKKGANVRVDLSLLGFKGQEWVHGERSFIFHGDADACTFIEVDHDAKVFYPNLLVIRDDVERLRHTTPPEELVMHKLSTPVMSTILGTDALAFSKVRNLLGFGSDREEEISGFRTKVYSATGVDIVTRTRVEHLSAADRPSSGDIVLPMQRLLSSDADGAPAESAPEAAGAGSNLLRTVAGITTAVSQVKTQRTDDLSAEDYFLRDPAPESVGDEIGRPMDLTVQKQSFKATAWLADSFPLSLRDQVLPVIELIATHSPHFVRVRDFIALQLPAGFPMKIEIPFFHIVQASITFGNLNGTTDSPPFVKRVCVPTSPSESSDAGTLIGGNGGDRGSSVAGGGIRHRTVDRTGSCDGSSVVRSGHSPEEPSVAPLQEVCVIDDECFQAPSGYRQLGRAGLQLMGTEDVFDDEEQMLQYAIRQSLQSQAGQPQTRRGDGREQVTFMEALMSSAPPSPQPPTTTSPAVPTSNPAPAGSAEDVELQRALIASMQDVGASTDSGHANSGSALPGIEMHHRAQQPNVHAGGFGNEDAEIQRALAMSASEEDERRRQQEAEEAELEQILRLSMSEQ